jgi:oxepin-CoA hydrolase/3-oxo-5,6-dehydrosuberyl-CoA semialdehyde dehydrogenase
MIAIPFDVNDEKLLKKFFSQLFNECITSLGENTPPLWGKMTPQNMVEHLVWAFECSNGIITAPCRTPGHLLERAKRFLYDNRPTPHEFKNPLLGENPLPFRFPSFTEAKSALHKEIARCVIHFQEQPGAIHVHPIFGPLGAEEWQRAHFKHCYHHLLQFGVIKESGAPPS